MTLPRWQQAPLLRQGLPYGNEGSRIACRRVTVRLGADDRADQRRHLLHAVRPLLGEVRVVVVLPAVGLGVGPAVADDLDGQWRPGGRIVPRSSSPPLPQSIVPLSVVGDVTSNVKVASAKIRASALFSSPPTKSARLWKLR